MRTPHLLVVCSLLLLFSCTESNESPSEKEVDAGPGVAGVDSAAYFNGRSDDSVSRITPLKTTK